MGDAIKRVEAGLKAMGVKPDALLYFPDQDSLCSTYESGSILDIAVYRCVGSFDDYRYAECDVPFVPVWESPQYDNGEVLLPIFRDAYEAA